MKKMNDKGFSLVELIIVIAIMAILIAVLAPQYIKYVEKARMSADLDNYQEVLTAIQVAYADSDNTSLAATATCKLDKTTSTCETALKNALKNEYGVDVEAIHTKSQAYSGKELTVTFTSSTGKFTITVNDANLAKELGITQTP